MPKENQENQLRKEALEYHLAEPRGKIKVVPTKPHSTAHELSLAYSPGVAYPCLEIAENPRSSICFLIFCLAFLPARIPRSLLQGASQPLSLLL